MTPQQGCDGADRKFPASSALHLLASGIGKRVCFSLAFPFVVPSGVSHVILPFALISSFFNRC